MKSTLDWSSGGLARSSTYTSTGRKSSADTGYTTHTRTYTHTHTHTHTPF
jgi:hypothetical protein